MHQFCLHFYLQGRGRYVLKLSFPTPPLLFNTEIFSIASPPVFWKIKRGCCKTTLKSSRTTLSFIAYILVKS